MLVMETIRRWVGTGPTNGHGTSSVLTEVSGAGGQVSANPKPQSPTPNPSPLGIVGTPSFAGWLRDLGEYNSKLLPPTAFLTYEKMRRSDADVAAVLAACKLPIRAAEYTVVPGVDANEPGYAAAKEIAEFVEANLFGGLEMEVKGRKVSQSFESVVENALLMLDFGCAAHEPTFRVDSDAVRIAHFAPRLPATFYRFMLGDDGETLAQLEQQGYSGDKYVTKQVPAANLDFFTFQREGANWWGRSLLRAAYKHWYVKEQLERIDAIACERNGMGVPVITQAEGATPDDREAAEAWIKNLSTHERTGLSLPAGWAFALKGVDGRPRDAMPSIKYHSEMIGRSVLATFLAYGTTQTGSRSLGESATDFFKLSLEATAWLIAETMTQGSIRQLVDYNFTITDRSLYPRLQFANILASEPYKLWETVNALADGGVIQPDDDLEAAAREDLGLPAKGEPRALPQMTQIAPNGEEANQKAKGKGQMANGEDEDPESQTLSERSSRASRRELKAWEQKVDYGALRRRQDATAKKVARILRAARPESAKQIARMASMTPTLGLQQLAVPVDHNVIAQLEQALAPVVDFGRVSVMRERFKATGRRASVPPQIAQMTQKESAKSADKVVLLADRLSRAKNAARLVAEATWADFSNWVAPRAIAAAVDATKRGILGEALAGAIEGALDELTDTGLDKIGMEAGRGAIAGGRYATLAEFDSEIARYVRTEADDANTCEVCDAQDGTEWTSLDEIDWQPGDDCLGGDLCRGQILAVFADEGKVTSQ